MALTMLPVSAVGDPLGRVRAVMPTSTCTPHGAALKGVIATMAQFGHVMHRRRWSLAPIVLLVLPLAVLRVARALWRPFMSI